MRQELRDRRQVSSISMFPTMSSLLSLLYISNNVEFLLFLYFQQCRVPLLLIFLTMSSFSSLINSNNVELLLSILVQQCRVSPLSIIPTMSSFSSLYNSNNVELLLSILVQQSRVSPLNISNNVEYFRSQSFQQCRVSQLVYRVSYLFCSMFAHAQIHQQKLQPNKSK